DAAGTEAAAVKVDGGRYNVVGFGRGSVAKERVAAIAAVLPLLPAAERVLLEREFEIGLGAVEAGLLQSAFQAALVALHQVERFGLFHGQPGMDLATLIDIQLDVDAAQFGRVEADLETGIAV